MLIDFFTTLRKAQIPVSINELLVLLEALKRQVAFASLDDFYLLSRTCLIKDEKHFDRFDRAFGHYFKGLDALQLFPDNEIPEDWLRAEFLKQLTDEEKAQIEAMGGLEAAGNLE